MGDQSYFSGSRLVQFFAGGVHDYFSGMISERNSGSSVAEFTGKYLGGVMQNIMRVFFSSALIMVGTVFAVGPAGLDRYPV